MQGIGDDASGLYRNSNHRDDGLLARGDRRRIEKRPALK
jgi:hypothetical protein